MTDDTDTNSTNIIPVNIVADGDDTSTTNSGEVGGAGAHDYDFLEEDLNKGKEGEETSLTKFDEAFSKASKEVQDYILGEAFPENISLICKLQKLSGEKENVIIENVAVSILVGLLSTSDAKDTLVESFKSSGITLEPLSASLILKDIDVYILGEVRKSILQSKIAKKEIRHLTLREEREEKQKEELRKVLLEKTGNLNGRGAVFEYKNRKTNTDEKDESKKGLMTLNKAGDVAGSREALLAKITPDVADYSDTEKLKERMGQIKIEEEERLKRLETRQQNEAEARINRQKEAEEKSILRGEKAKEENLSYENTFLARDLEEKINSGEGEAFDLNTVIKKREREEGEKEMIERRRVADQEDIRNANADPYRETV